MDYDQDSFLAGLAFARNVVGWVGGRGESWINDSTVTTFTGVLIGADGYVTAKPLTDIIDISSDGPVTSRAVASALNSKQNALTFDQTPQAGSSNPVYSNGIAVQLNLKAPLLSPNFAGEPHAPTPTAGASNSQIATTEFVMQAIGSGGNTPKTKLSEVSLSSSWSSSEPYYQVVSISETVPSNALVELQPDANQLLSLMASQVKALFISNDSGVLTAYALGSTPSAMTIQCTIEEVEV